MKSIFGSFLLFFGLSLHAQNKWSITAETGVSIDRFKMNDGSTWYSNNNGGPYLFNTSSTGFLGGLTARYHLKKAFMLNQVFT